MRTSPPTGVDVWVVEIDRRGPVSWSQCCSSSHQWYEISWDHERYLYQSGSLAFTHFIEFSAVYLECQIDRVLDNQGGMYGGRN